MFPHPRVTASEQLSFGASSERKVLDLAEMGFIELFFVPIRPELALCFSGAIATVSHADGKQELRKGKELGYLVLLLVADGLANPFLHHGAVGIATIRSLGLDHDEGNAVHVCHKVRPPCAGAQCIQNLQFLGNNEAVVGKILPIDHWHRDTGFLRPYKFRHREAECESVVKLLIRRQQPVMHDRG